KDDGDADADAEAGARDHEGETPGEQLTPVQPLVAAPPGREAEEDEQEEGPGQDLAVDGVPAERALLHRRRAPQRRPEARETPAAGEPMQSGVEEGHVQEMG